MREFTNIIAAAAFAVLAFKPVQSRANVFEDVWAIPTDPIKLNSASKTLADSLDRTMAQLDVLRQKTNLDVTDRLNQIRSLIADALAGSTALLDKAENDMLKLEAAVNSDATRLIYRAQCAAALTIDRGREAFANAVDDLGRADPSLHIFGIKIIDVSTKKIEIELPDQAYWNTKKKLYDRLRATVTDRTDAYDIFSLYANLESMANYTLCHYIDQPGMNKIWAQEMAQMEVLAAPWTNVVFVSK